MTRIPFLRPIQLAAVVSLLGIDLSISPICRGQSVSPLETTSTREVAPSTPSNRNSDASSLVTPAVDNPVPISLWSLETLQERAFELHPALCEMASKIEAAKGSYLQSGLQSNPSVGYQGQQLGSNGRAEQHGIAFGRDIIRREKLDRSQAIASAEIQRLRHEWETIRYRIQTDLHIAFLDALAAQRQYALTTELVEVARKGATMAQQLRDANEVSKIDVLQASVEVDKATILLENASNRIRSSWQTLATLTCLPVDCPERLQGELESPISRRDFCEILAYLKSASPEISAACATIQRNREILSRAKVEVLPNLNVQGLVNWRDNGIGGEPDGGVQVMVPIPLRNKNQGAIYQALSELRAAEHALAKLELDLQQRLAIVFERYLNASQQEEKFRSKILPSAKESLDLTRMAYKEGEASFVILLTTQRTYFDTSLSLLEALRQRRIAEAEMDGMLLMRSLEKGP